MGIVRLKKKCELQGQASLSLFSLRLSRNILLVSTLSVAGPKLIQVRYWQLRSKVLESRMGTDDTSACPG